MSLAKSLCLLRVVESEHSRVTQLQQVTCRWCRARGVLGGGEELTLSESSRVSDPAAVDVAVSLQWL